MRTHTVGKVFVWQMRLVAGVLAFMLIASILLVNLSQVRIQSLAYADSEHAMATNALLDSTQYLSQSPAERAFTFLRAFLTPTQTFSRCYTMASAAIGRMEYGDALGYVDYCISLSGAAQPALLADLWLKKGCLHALLGDPQTAVPSLDMALEMDAYVARDAYYVKMQLLVAQGDMDGAIGSLSSYLTLEQDGELYNVLGDLHMAESHYELASQAYTTAIALGENGGHAQFMRGICSMQLGDRVAADADFTKALELEMQPAMSHYYRGVMRLSQGRYVEAERDFTTAMEAEEEQIGIMELWYNRGVSRMAQGNFAAAAEDFDVSAQRGEAVQDSLFQRGVCLLEVGNPQLADACFTAYLEHGGSIEQVIYYQAMARMYIGQFSEAASDFSRCINEGIYPLDSRFYRAQCYMAQEAYRLAISDLTVCMEAGGFEETAPYYRGLCYLALGEVEKGEADLALAVETPAPGIGEQER